MILGDNFFSRYKSVSDLQREQEEFEARKRLNELNIASAEQQLNAPKQLSSEQLIAQAIQLGGVDKLSPEQQAQLQAFDVTNRLKQSVDPRGNIISNRSIYDMLPRQINQMPPREVMSAPTRPIYSSQPFNPSASQIPQATPEDVAQLEAVFDPNGVYSSMEQMPTSDPVVLTRPVENMPSITPPNMDGLSPYTREDLLKKAGEADIQFQVSQAEEQLKTKRGQQKVTQILDRMSEINNQLKDMGSIQSQGQNVAGRLGTYISTTGTGQEARKVVNPAAQALAEEYKNLQSSLLPFYASAAGLGAKSLDSEGERKSILSSFGDPAGIYEANQRQLQNLAGLFGSEIKNTPNKRLKYNPQTGRLE